MRQYRTKREPRSADRTIRYSAYCAAPYPGRRSQDLYCYSCVITLTPSACVKIVETTRPRFRATYSSNCPPRQGLPQTLGHKQPVVRQLVRRLPIRFGRVTVVEGVAVKLNLVVRINFGRNYFGFLLIDELRPAARSIPVLANCFAILEFDLDLHRNDESFLAL